MLVKNTTTEDRNSLVGNKRFPVSLSLSLAHLFEASVRVIQQLFAIKISVLSTYACIVDSINRMTARSRICFGVVCARARSWVSHMIDHRVVPLSAAFYDSLLFSDSFTS